MARRWPVDGAPIQWRLLTGVSTEGVDTLNLKKAKALFTEKS